MRISDDQLFQILQTVERWVLQADTWNIILSMISVVVAAIAVVVSICTARTQNKIALYERRMECYQRFEKLKSYSKFVDNVFNSDNQNPNSQIHACQAEYLFIHNINSENKEWNQAMYSIHRDAYALACLDSDLSSFSTAKMLIKIKDAEQFDRAFESLRAFVTELFKSSCCASILKREQHNFSENFKKIDKYSEIFEKSLQIYGHYQLPCANYMKARREGRKKARREGRKNAG